jgi:hypothetical protein
VYGATEGVPVEEAQAREQLAFPTADRRPPTADRRPPTADIARRHRSQNSRKSPIIAASIIAVSGTVD